MSVPNPSGSPAGRRRAWLLAGVVALLVAVYLASWTAYSTDGLVAYSRYRQQPAGAAVSVEGAQVTVLQMTRTAMLAGNASRAGEGVPAGPHLVWVVVDLLVLRSTADETFACGFDLLGPDRRRWEAALSPASGRRLSTFCDVDDIRTGVPYRYQEIFSVPVTFVDQLYGVVPENAEEPIPVLRPAS